jgi:cytolysin-activating lysine-acyltransferase
MIEPVNRLTLEEWKGGDRLWLVDLVAPFADEENKQRQIMLADLISGPLAGREFKFHQTDPSGRRVVQVVAADAGERLKEAVRDAASH